MPNQVTIQGSNQTFSGELILTDYGRDRVLQRVAQDTSFEPFNLTEVVIGNRLNNAYNSSITAMGSEIQSFSISNDNISVVDNVCYIRCELDLEGEVTLQEIGVFETINNSRRLFAYASGFSMVKSANVTYDLIVRLELSMAFNNEHYSNYDVVLDDSEYALAPEIDNMWGAIGRFQLDLERCVEANTIKLGYNKAQAYILEHQNMIDILRNTLVLGRYEKLINRLGNENITDCFYYPSEKPRNYFVKNLKDSNADKYTDILGNYYSLETNEETGEQTFVNNAGEVFEYAEKDDSIGYYSSANIFVTLTRVEESSIEVTGNLQIANRDNINLSTAASLMYTCTLNSFNREGFILGKCNPNQDEYYFDLRMIYDSSRDTGSLDTTTSSAYGLQFTIYSYDSSKVYDVEHGNYDERKLVGHYRIKYFPPTSQLTSLAEDETMFTFVYNGDINNPEIKMYIGTELVNNNEGFIVDNFNYMGPCQDFMRYSTLRNYSQTVSTQFEAPMYYFLPGVENTSIIAFNIALDEDDIEYLSIISRQRI